MNRGEREGPMDYKGYTATVAFDDADGVFSGRVVGLRDDGISFEGTTVEELRREFHAAVDFYLDVCATRGDTPEKPYTGKILVRADAELHRAVAVAAAQDGTSMNEWAVRTLGRAVGLTR